MTAQRKDLSEALRQYLPPMMLDLSSWSELMSQRLHLVMFSYAREAWENMWARLRARTGGSEPPPEPPNGPFLPGPNGEGPRRPVLEGAFPVVNQRLQDAVDALTLRFCEETNNTTSEELSDALERTRDALRQGTVEGLAIKDLSRRVNEVFDRAETWRAKRIAITESSRAVHLAEQISAEESGVVKGFRWLASADACPLCMALDGKEVPLGVPFEVGTSTVPEYSDVYFPPRHPNCQCTTIEVLLPE